MNDRWNYTDKKLKEIFKKYNKLNKRTQDKLQDVFNNFNFTYQEIFKYASMKNLRKVNRIIEELKENNLINDYYGKSLLNKIYKKIRVKNSLILEFMIYMCFLEERKNLDEYENLMFNDLMNTEYQKAQKEVYSLKNDSRKPIALTDTFLLLLLGMPNPKGYVWTNYIDASLLYNSNQIYRQALINLQQNKFLDIESDSFQNILRKQRNTYLSIHDGIISGDLELQTTFLVNNSIKEGYLAADPDAKVRFIAEMDKKTTKMCDTLNNQIFKLNDWNTYQRYSEEDKRIITYKTFGLEVGANLPPINNHFHWCRSTITYQIDGKYNELIAEYNQLKRLIPDDIPDTLEEYGYLRYNQSGYYEEVKSKEIVKKHFNKEFELKESNNPLNYISFDTYYKGYINTKEKLSNINIQKIKSIDLSMHAYDRMIERQVDYDMIIEALNEKPIINVKNDSINFANDKVKIAIGKKTHDIATVINFKKGNDKHV